LHVLTDAAWYSPVDGSVLEISSKVVTIGNARAVVVGRGDRRVTGTFAAHASRYVTSFDQLVRLFDVLMVDVAKAVYPAIGDHLFNHELMLAGWSEALDAPEIWYEAGHGLSDLADGHLRPIPGSMWGGGPEPHLQAYFDTVTDDDVERFDAHRDGIPVFEAMRREPGDLSSGFGEPLLGHGIGGFLEHVTITRAGVIRETIHQWPDEVGRPIQIHEEGSHVHH
jgi:hypothetical protein